MELKDKFSILITTRNRIFHLKNTIHSLNPVLKLGIKLIICDDGSDDNTSRWIKQHYPQVELITNKISKGYIKNRNSLLAMVTTPYAVSLDDDASIISPNPFAHIARHFENNPNCGLIAMRIFWGISPPENTFSRDSKLRVKSYVGCGHAWRLEAWKSIPDYPSWYKFYGEEDFASFHLYKKNWEVHYLPEILVHHKASLKARKKEKDYINRLRNSLRAGWSNYFIFYPWNLIPKRFIYSIWMQMKLKVFKGELKVLWALALALNDTLKNIRRIQRCRSPLTKEEYRKFEKLADTKYYWKE